MIRTEIDSMPEELDKLTRKALQVEIEIKALQKKKLMTSQKKDLQTLKRISRT